MMNNMSKEELLLPIRRRAVDVDHGSNECWLFVSELWWSKRDIHIQRVQGVTWRQVHVSLPEKLRDEKIWDAVTACLRV